LQKRERVSARQASYLTTLVGSAATVSELQLALLYYAILFFAILFYSLASSTLLTTFETTLETTSITSSRFLTEILSRHLRINPFYLKAFLNSFNNKQG